MSRGLLKPLGVVLVVIGVVLLAASAYAMYRLGVSGDPASGATVAQRGIASAIAGSASLLLGLAALKAARDDASPPVEK